ncbi:MAG TPA: Ku protein [Methylophilaceae bacterium]|nr:Ku protein [Methylophilaceae bacterium]
MPRAIWKGAISFGLVHIPVELYPAESQKGLDLDMLDRRDFAPVGYKRYNKETGKDIDWNDIVKGYEYEKGQYVVLSDEDLKRANVEATQTIDIVNFVDTEEVPPIYFEQPYYLAPTKGGDKVYVLLRETLRKAGKIGIAQVVIRTKQRLAALMPMENAIVLNLLRYGDEIRPLKDITLPDATSKKAAVSDKEIKMAMSLLEDMTEPWDPMAYHDTYREDVMALVEKKIKANQTKTVTQPEKDEERQPAASNVVDLMELLRKSINTKKTGGKGQTEEDDEEEEEDKPRKKAEVRTASRRPADKKAAEKKPAAKKQAGKQAPPGSRKPPGKPAEKIRARA